MNTYAILELIPHRPPMALLDAVVEYGPEHLTARMTVSKGKLFTDADGAFPAWAGIELMAQTIAAFGGLSSVALGEPAKIGFPLDTVLTINARRLILNNDGLGVFECRIDSCVGAICANISVYQPDDPQRFVREAAT